jgi:hypothetical protein
VAYPSNLLPLLVEDMLIYTSHKMEIILPLSPSSHLLIASQPHGLGKLTYSKTAGKFQPTLLY